MMNDLKNWKEIEKKLKEFGGELSGE